MINETIQLTQGELMQMHNSIVIPTLIFFYLVMSFSFLLVGLKIVEHSRKKIFTIWIYASIISALFLIFLIVFPNTTQTILTYFGGLIK